jgi:hypothetical protein
VAATGDGLGVVVGELDDDPQLAAPIAIAIAAPAQRSRLVCMDPPGSFTLPF